MKNGILAFCGSKGSGKDTSATIFKEFYKGPTEQLAFAGHLKNVCSKVFNIDMKYFTDPSLKEVELEAYINLTPEKIEQVFKGFNLSNYTYNAHIRQHIGSVFDTPRSLLQYIGTEVLHPLDPLVHVKATLNNKDPNKLSIITDLRFLQEYEFLAGQPGFVPVYVQNNVAESRAASDNHKSEREVKLFKDKCTILSNNGDLTALTKIIKTLIQERYA